MESFTKELVSNESAQLFPDNTLSSFANFLPEQLNLQGQWDVAISERSYPSMYQNVTEGKIMLFDKKFSKSSEFYYLECGLYPSITDIVEAMNTLLWERHNPSEICITAKVSRGTQKVEIYLEKEGAGAFFSTDLGHVFGSNVGNEFGVMLRGKRPHKPDFAYEIVRIHSFMIYTDLIEYSVVGDTKAPMLCFFFLFRSSRLEALKLLDSTWNIGHLATSNSNRCSKILSIVFTLTWETQLVKKYPLYLSVSLVLFGCSQKPPTSIFNRKDVTIWLLHDK